MIPASLGRSGALRAKGLAGLWIGAVCLLSACGAKKVDSSPVGTVKQFVGASLVANTQKRHQGLYKLLGPRSQARLKASADRATEAAGNKRKYAPHEMLSASFRPMAKGNWTPKSFKLVGKSADTARVAVHGEKKGQVQIVTLVKAKGRWRIELDPLPAPGSAPRPGPGTTTPSPAVKPKT